MARSIASLIFAFSATAALLSAAEDRSAPAATPTPALPVPPCSSKGDGAKPNGSPRKERTFPGGAVDAEKAKEAFRNMSPEERERWLRRFRDWADMPPEKKKSLADREEFFRRKMREDIEAAQKEAGVELTEEQKRLFAQRYVEERRKIEEQLRREMEESRKPRVKALCEKLRQEFAAPVKQQ
jgi:hypothetical protein